MSDIYGKTPHEIHRKLRENGYEPTVMADEVNVWAERLKIEMRDCANAALGAGEDRVLVVLVDGITGDVCSAAVTTDHVHPELIRAMKHRREQ